MLHEGGDDATQGQQTLVNVARLSRPLVHRPRPTNVLTARKIHLYHREDAC